MRTLDDTVCGLSGTGPTGTTFDRDGRLRRRMSCGGDQSACEGTRAGPFRQTAAGPQRVVTDLASRISGSAVATRTPIVLARSPRTTAGRWVGPIGLVYRCDTVTAVAQPSYRDIRPPREIFAAARLRDREGHKPRARPAAVGAVVMMLGEPPHERDRLLAGASPGQPAADRQPQLRAGAALPQDLDVRVPVGTLDRHDDVAHDRAQQLLAVAIAPCRRVP